MPDYLLELYVTGGSPRAEQAIASLRRICAGELDGRCELKVIDVLEHPELAERARILATPTLIRRRPLPLRRVIGDLADGAEVLHGLELWVDPSPAGPA